MLERLKEVMTSLVVMVPSLLFPLDSSRVYSCLFFLLLVDLVDFDA
jgi:hypothetical protein